MEEKQTVPIYMACDDNYAIHLSVVLASIVANSSANLHFIVMYSRLSSENKIKITKSVINNKIDFVSMQYEIDSLSTLKERFKKGHISIETCLRYFIPKLNFPYDKGIYLDCDLIVLDDVSKLYNFNLGENYIAGAFDAARKKYIKKLGLSKYFNAGVLLLNIKKMRDDDLTEILFEKTLELKDKLKYMDQDVLNLVCKGKSKFFELRWGLTSPFFRKKISSKLLNQEEIKEAIYNPGIVHFTGPKKPWDISSGLTANPYAPAYFYYLNQTAFKDRTKSMLGNLASKKNLFYLLKRSLQFLTRPRFYKMYLLYKKNTRKYNVK